MKQLNLAGCGTALVTPFRNNKPDYEAYIKLLKRQTDAGIHFLVPLGTTAETPNLEEDEKLEILKLTKEYACGRPVVVGGGTNSLTQTIKSIRTLEPLNPDAFLIVVPYYNKPTQKGMYEYFKAVAESTCKSIVLYNVPGRTGSNLSAQTCLALAEIPNIVAVKEASGNYSQISEIIRNAPEGFSVLSGNDDETLSLMATGASGVISVASNVAPKEMVLLTEALLNDNIAQARELHHKLSHLFKNCFIESNPIPVKAALSVLGLIENELRLPLTSSSPETYSIIEETIRELGL